MIAAPAPAGDLLAGRAARKPTARMMFRFYGTRDVVLGLGTLRAASSDDQVRGWLMAGIASDVLDAAVMLIEWKEIPAEKRLPGIATALGAAGVGAALLTRRRA